MQGEIVHIQNLIAVAFADGVFDEVEKEFLYEVAYEYNVSDEQVEELLARSSELEFVVPEDHDEREEQLINIVFMSMLDGDFHENEYALCMDVATRLGLTKEDLDEAVTLTKRLTENAKEEE